MRKAFDCGSTGQSLLASQNLPLNCEILLHKIFSFCELQTLLEMQDSMDGEELALDSDAEEEEEEEVPVQEPSCERAKSGRHFLPVRPLESDEDRSPRPKYRAQTARTNHFDLEFERSPYFSRPFEIYKVRPPDMKRSARSVKTARVPPPTARWSRGVPLFEKETLRESDYLERMRDDDRRSREYDRTRIVEYKRSHPMNLYRRDNVKIWTAQMIDPKIRMRQREAEEFRLYEIRNRRRRREAERRRQILLKEQEMYEIKRGKGLDPMFRS